jgi:quercetin dioxygenase-like cupin family protein
MPLYDWSQVAKEYLNPQTTRQVIHAENITVAQVHLEQGAIVPEHSHMNEQVTFLMSGRVKLVYPDHEQIVEPGQVIQTPPNVPHRLEALETSAAIDVFAPRRNDWIQGEGGVAETAEPAGLIHST